MICETNGGTRDEMDPWMNEDKKIEDGDEHVDKGYLLTSEGRESQCE